MPGICAAVTATTSYSGRRLKKTLKLWKSRPAAPRITMRIRPFPFSTVMLVHRRGRGGRGGRGGRLSPSLSGRVSPALLCRLCALCGSSLELLQGLLDDLQGLVHFGVRRDEGRDEAGDLLVPAAVD